VNPNSLAERCGIRDDDYILKIGPISAEYLQHHDAQEHIKRQNNILELILQRSIELIKENKK
jgi:C-terminal processing protease CtpA/Prc